eukprot:gene124-biopygen125
MAKSEPECLYPGMRITSMRSSNGPGMVSVVFAVHTSQHRCDRCDPGGLIRPIRGSRISQPWLRPHIYLPFVAPGHGTKHRHHICHVSNVFHPIHRPPDEYVPRLESLLDSLINILSKIQLHPGAMNLKRKVSLNYVHRNRPAAIRFIDNTLSVLVPGPVAPRRTRANCAWIHFTII